MINSKIGIDILDGFCRCETQNTPIDFDIDNVYLGLLKKLPKNDETTYEDGSYCEEPSDQAYMRVKLNATHILNQVPYISSAEIEIVDGISSAYVVNNAYIMFDETSQDWGEIKGFGLFSKAKDKESPCELPYLWGTITTPDEEPVIVGAEEIPIIGRGNFKISLR